MLFFAVGGILCTVLAMRTLTHMRPWRKGSSEGWWDYFWRMYFIPANVVFAAVIGWLGVFAADFDVSSEEYLALIAWAVLLWYIGERTNESTSDGGARL